MTEYLILSLNRALPLVWEYNKAIIFNLTFSRSFGNIPRSILERDASTGGLGVLFDLNSTSRRIFRTFGTPPRPTSLPQGVKDISAKLYLYRIAFMLQNWSGNPQFRIDLHYANPDDTPGLHITSFTPSVIDHASTVKTVYVDWGDPLSGYQLDWNTKYAVVLVPTVANTSNWARAASYTTSAADPLPPRRCGYSSDGGVTWTFSSGTNPDWSTNSSYPISVGVAFYYESNEITIPIAKSSEAFRSYFNGWASRTTPPSGFTIWRDIINGVANPTSGTEIRFTDTYTHLMRFGTTADVAGFTQTDTASFKWQYDINPVTIDMFYASEAYLQRIDFLANGSSVRLNDSYEQEFSGNAGASVTFDPPILWWKAQVLSGAVRLRALVFE